MVEFRGCKLADVCDAIDYGFTAAANVAPVGPKFLRITDIVSADLDWASVPHVEGSISSLDQYRLHDADIVIARTGATTGESRFIRNPPEAVFASYLVRLKVNASADPRYVAYWLKSPAFRDYLHGVLGDKSAQPNASATTMTSAPMQIPVDKSYQSTVASLLGALDDKIESNRRMNFTLEATARAIFADWFVDFGPTRAKMKGEAPYLESEIWRLFPDRLDGENKPHGWATSTVEAAFLLVMGQSPPGNTYNESGEGMPFFQGRTDFGSRYPTRRMYCTAPTRFANQDDTLVSVRAPVGDLNMAWEKCCIGRGVAAIRHRSGARSYTFYALSLIQTDLSAFEDTGTVFGSINKHQFEALKVIAPPPHVVAAFEATVSGLDERIRSNEMENTTLTETRNLLLPKLMSGEIRVKDAGKMVEASP